MCVKQSSTLFTTRPLFLPPRRDSSGGKSVERVLFVNRNHFGIHRPVSASLSLFFSFVYRGVVWTGTATKKGLLPETVAFLPLSPAKVWCMIDAGVIGWLPPPPLPPVFFLDPYPPCVMCVVSCAPSSV